MKKRAFIFVIMVVIAIPLIPQYKMLKTTRTLTLSRTKIKVDGYVAYYGNARYISAHIELSYNGKPITTPVVKINNRELANYGNGKYTGVITPYNGIAVGDRFVFTAKFPKGDIHILGEESYAKEIILATYRVDNIINWVYPKPRQVINVKNVLTVPLRWDFTGTPKPTELYIKDAATNKKILSKIISNESLKVSPSLFKPGKTYRMGLWAYDPLGNFKITNMYNASSKVVFYFSDVMTFKTGNEISVLESVYRKR